MNLLQRYLDADLSWKSWGALILFSCGLLGFLSGVDVSERPGLPDEDFFTKAYYVFGLFVLGGLDLGTPQGGPLHGRILVWIAYFGAPIWTASAAVGTVLTALRPRVWRTPAIRRHIVIIGGGNLSIAFINRIKQQFRFRRILVIVGPTESEHIAELQSYRRVEVMQVRVNQRHRLRGSPMHKAHRLLLLSESDYINADVASILLETHPDLGSKIVLHISNLRLLRVLHDSPLIRQCTSFNGFQMCASHLCETWLIRRFNATHYRDTVVFAGFGRFGQSILEELELHAAEAFSRVAIIDLAAERRALIADEQVDGKRDYIRYTFQGDIDDPEIWSQLFKEVVILDEEPVFILGTGNDEKNIRSAIWLRQQFANALIISRTHSPSSFARVVSRQYNIVCVSMAELIEKSIPASWYE